MEGTNINNIKFSGNSTSSMMNGFNVNYMKPVKNSTSSMMNGFNVNYVKPVSKSRSKMIVSRVNNIRHKYDTTKEMMKGFSMARPRVG